MRRIAEIIEASAVEANLRASNKPGVLRELVGLILKQEPNLDPNELVEVLFQRERLQSTGVGDCVAIPHGRTAAVQSIVACFGRSNGGVDFQSLDGVPTRLFFTLFVPEHEHGAHLKALARVSRLLKSAEVREALLLAEDSDAIYRILVDADDAL